jgi:hypothetical protein
MRSAPLSCQGIIHTGVDRYRTCIHTHIHICISCIYIYRSSMHVIRTNVVHTGRCHTHGHQWCIGIITRNGTNVVHTGRIHTGTNGASVSLHVMILRACVSYLGIIHTGAMFTHPHRYRSNQPCAHVRSVSCMDSMHRYRTHKCQRYPTYRYHACTPCGYDG